MSKKGKHKSKLKRTDSECLAGGRHRLGEGIARRAAIDDRGSEEMSTKECPTLCGDERGCTIPCVYWRSFSALCSLPRRRCATGSSLLQFLLFHCVPQLSLARVSITGGFGSGLSKYRQHPLRWASARSCSRGSSPPRGEMRKNSK